MTPIIFLLGQISNSLLELRTLIPPTRIAYAETTQSIDILEDIALCESGNDPLAKNASSTASGRFQFVRSSWNGYGKELWGEELKNKNVFDWNDNTELAVYTYNKVGTSPWDASKDCWNKAN